MKILFSAYGLVHESVVVAAVPGPARLDFVGAGVARLAPAPTGGHL